MLSNIFKVPLKEIEDLRQKVEINDHLSDKICLQTNLVDSILEDLILAHKTFEIYNEHNTKKEIPLKASYPKDNEIEKLKSTINKYERLLIDLASTYPLTDYEDTYSIEEEYKFRADCALSTLLDTYHTCPVREDIVDLLRHKIQED